MSGVAGATGRVGSSAAQHLLTTGAEVRVLVRRRADAEAWECRGAEARTVSLEDSTALSRALEGCSGLFALLPFDLTADDPDAHAEALAGSVAATIPESAWADTLVEAGLRPHWQARSSSSASASSRDFATSMIRPTSARTGR